MYHNYTSGRRCVDEKFYRFQIRNVFHIFETPLKYAQIISHFLSSCRSFKEKLETKHYSDVWVRSRTCNNQLDILEPQKHR